MSRDEVIALSWSGITACEVELALLQAQVAHQTLLYLAAGVGAVETEPAVLHRMTILRGGIVAERALLRLLEQGQAGSVGECGPP